MRFPFLRVEPRFWRAACIGLALTILACSTFFTLALVNIYSTPNTRVQASEWIYNHIRPGATLTNEIWDDPLPIQVPPASTANGVPLTAAGHTINPSEYGQVGLDLYADDTPQKAQTLSQQLASADVVVISSQRLVRSIPKLPDRYPMTTRYYQLLFEGRLGFTLAAHFQNAPNLFGLTINDSGADESYSVYDHPPVWIFVKQGAGLTAAQIQDDLTAGLTLPATSNRPGSQKSLLLSSQNQAADAQSQPIGIQFPANSLPNSIPLIWWLLIIELLGIVTFPLTFFVFRGLKDRGWGLSKTLGILLLAYLTWLPASVRALPFDHWVVVLAFAVVAAAGAAVAWRWREEMWAFVRQRWRLLAIGEVLFLAAFLYFTWIRALDPDLWHIYRGGEKPMELAFMNSILRSRYMPPYDPWFSGGYINYYYYGQYIMAVLIRLTGITTTTAFNLEIPLLFGLTFSGAFSVLAGLTGKWWAGLTGGLALVVVGNLDGLWQLLNQVRSWLAGLPISPFDYWQSSRVIPCDTISGVQLPNCAQTTINEFPYWSYLYADLHAHVIDLPIVVLIIAACASIIATIQRTRRARAQQTGARGAPLQTERSPQIRDSRVSQGQTSLWDLVPTLAVLALALGAAWCTSTWDVPTYGLLIAIVLALRLLIFGGANGDDPTEGGWRAWIAWPRMRVYLAATGLTFAATYLLYFPFHANYQNLTSGVGTVTTPTAPFQFFTLFGIWLFLLVSFFFVELHDRIIRNRAALISSSAASFVGASAGRPRALDGGSSPSVAMPSSTSPLSPRGEGLGVRTPDGAYLPIWLFLAGLAVVLLFAYLISLKTLLIILLAVGLYLAWDRRHSPTKLLTYVLLLLGLAVALGVEFIYIRD
ncbi:MAG TPA: DUF2298 domain-containing protein, partial [Ktedonobacterales bacterium]|nr:DUF2298 domain-containing protein [Ktedonobacterales bacterium]